MKIAALAALALVGACHAPASPAAPPQAAADGDYAAPPNVDAVGRRADQVILSGRAPPGSRVRLATPTGEARFAAADKEGRWSLPAPAPAKAAIFGLSAQVRGRQVQAEGYLLIGARGQAALLRAGAGALRLDRPPGAWVAALDFDRDGGAILSGWAPPGSDVVVRLDGGQAAEGRADAAGRYSIGFNRISPGPHRFEAAGVGFTQALDVTASPPAALDDGPLRSQLIPDGLRADWLTPGGGVQSTVLAG